LTKEKNVMITNHANIFLHWGLDLVICGSVLLMLFNASNLSSI